MSNGKIHDKFTKQLSIPISLLLFIIVNPIIGLDWSIWAFFLCYIGCNIQRFQTPDCDVDDGFYGFFLVRFIFGEWIGKLWQYFWYPYAKVVPHRSFISHVPILSTIIRFLYILFPIIIINLFLKLYIFYYWDWWLYILIGLITMDLGHIALDFIYPFRIWYESFDKN